MEIRMTRHEVRLALGLDRAAFARRKAAKRQDNAKFLCVECHGPDDQHTSECKKGKNNK